MPWRRRPPEDFCDFALAGGARGRAVGLPGGRPLPVGAPPGDRLPRAWDRLAPASAAATVGAVPRRRRAPPRRARVRRRRRGDDARSEGHAARARLHRRVRREAGRRSGAGDPLLPARADPPSRLPRGVPVGLDRRSGGRRLLSPRRDRIPRGSRPEPSGHERAGSRLRARRARARLPLPRSARLRGVAAHPAREFKQRWNGRLRPGRGRPVTMRYAVLISP